MKRITLEQFLSLFNDVNHLEFQLYDNELETYLGKEEENFSGLKYPLKYKNWSVTSIDGPNKFGWLFIYLDRP